jgi:hypothetical protein
MGLNLQRIRVPAGFVFAAVYLAFCRPTPGSAKAGIALAFCGLMLRTWAAGCIEKGRELETSGPYRWTRNPLYVGSFLIGLGASIASASAWVTLAFFILFAAIYLPVMHREERELAAAFPDAFPDYRRAVPMFWPRLARSRMTSSSSTGRRQHWELTPDRSRTSRRFRWERLRRNREYNAIVGFAGWTAWICYLLWRG